MRCGEQRCRYLLVYQTNLPSAKGSWDTLKALGTPRPLRARLVAPAGVSQAQWWAASRPRPRRPDGTLDGRVAGLPSRRSLPARLAEQLLQRLLLRGELLARLRTRLGALRPEDRGEARFEDGPPAIAQLRPC